MYYSVVIGVSVDLNQLFPLEHRTQGTVGRDSIMLQSRRWQQVAFVVCLHLSITDLVILSLSCPRYSHLFCEKTGCG